MTEQTVSYGSPNRTPSALEGFYNLPCMKLYNEGYQPPEPEQVKALIELSGMSRKQWAGLLGISYSEKHGSTTLRKWCLDKSKKDYREINYSTWRLMLMYVRLIDPGKDLAATTLAKGQPHAAST